MFHVPFFQVLLITSCIVVLLYCVYLFLEAVSLQNAKHLSKNAIFPSETIFLQFIITRNQKKQTA